MYGVVFLKSMACRIDKNLVNPKISLRSNGFPCKTIEEDSA